MSDSSSDLDTLKNIAKVPIKVKEDHPLSEVHSFILAKDIKRGDAQIPATLIYKLYVDWKGKNTLTITKFFRDFSNYFARKKSAKYNYYLLDPGPFNLSDEAYEAAKELHQKIQQDQQRETKKQKQIKEKHAKEKDSSKS